MDNTALLQEVTAKAQVWLNGNFDEDTKKEVKALLDSSGKSGRLRKNPVLPLTNHTEKTARRTDFPAPPLLLPLPPASLVENRVLYS